MPTSDKSSSALRDSLAAPAWPLEHGDLHIFECGERRQEMKGLENEAERLGAKAVEILAGGEPAAPRKKSRRSSADRARRAG